MSLTIIKKSSDYLDYILEGIKKKDVRIIDIQTKESLFWRMMHLLTNGHSEHPTKFLSSYISYKNIKELKSIDSDNVLLLGAIDFRLSNILATLIPNKTKKHSWMWNPLGLTEVTRITSELEYSRRLGFSITTFNPIDAAKYNIPLLNQVYRYYEGQAVKVHDEAASDCYWLGNPKGRLGIINEIKSILEGQGLKCDFRIVEKREDRLSYAENLDLVHSTKCLVDLNNSDNQGLSLRVMEAIFTGKKLITNNQFVKVCDFYTPNNIFIIGLDNVDELPAFISKELQSIDADVLDKYDINHWLQQFE